MTYQPSHRKPREPRWHDRPRAWLAAALDWLSGTLNDDAPQPYWEGTDDNGEPIGADLPPVDYEPHVIRTAKVSGVHLPLSGDHVNPWINCAFTRDVPRPGSEDNLAYAQAGPGYRQNVPPPSIVESVQAGRGHLGMFDLAYVRSPWPPRPDDTVIISAPRVCAGRIALLAGGW